MMRNNLFIRRLRIITEQNAVAYDETFHTGINIIRGNNSSGKSTITHFIFFVLGGAFNDFVPEARKCFEVYAEVEMNGAVFTIKRYLEKNQNDEINAKSALYFFWDSLDVALNPPQGSVWQKFGYNSYENIKSFSNVIFESLDIPIVKGDNNITFHQVLRLLYVDQESPTNSLFYYEQFDSQITRETVADLLLGIYDEELYEDKKRLIAVDKELEIIKSTIKTTKQFFSDPLTLDPIHIRTVIENKSKEITNIENKIISLREKSNESRYTVNSKLNFQKFNNEVLQQRSVVLSLESKIEKLKNEIYDSEYFIETLKNKIIALKKSIDTRSFLGNLPLEYCPECLTEIKELRDENPSTKCKLCKEVIDDSFGVIQARRMELEISFQIQDSTKLLEHNKKELDVLDAKLSSEKIKLHHQQKQVNTVLRDVRPYNDEAMDSLNRDRGFIEGEILQYRTMLENAELYQKQIKKKAELTKESDTLHNSIFYREGRQKGLKTEVLQKIQEEELFLLNNDLDRQEEFKNANEFTIDFSNNMAFLANKYSKYSASSNFYLKVTARFSLFLASLSLDFMRYPRFIFADNMEDKGIEPKRAENLQKILINRLGRFKDSTYQVIYTTSYITKELNESPYVVGDYYTKANPSLKNIPI